MHRQTSGGNLESIDERLWTVDCKQTNKQTDRQTNRQTEPINILGQVINAGDFITSLAEGIISKMAVKIDCNKIIIKKIKIITLQQDPGSWTSHPGSQDSIISRILVQTNVLTIRSGKHGYLHLST